MKELGFRLYLLFLVSFFMHLTSRFPVLGTIRFDLLLVALISGIIIMGKENGDQINDEGGTSKYLKILILFIIATLPLVEWPGSALKAGVPGFIKAVIFFYFTVKLATSVRKLKLVIYVLMGCQVLRVLEPLYLNIADGYWGSQTHIGGGEFASRLGGAPADIINPNELGYVIIVSIILLYHMLVVRGPIIVRIIALGIIGACVYAMILTASRSAFLVLSITFLIIIWNTKHRYLLLFITGIGVFYAAGNLSDFHKDRYFSMFSSDTVGAATAQGRINSLLVDLEVTKNRPIVGHGLGTSKEANFNVKGKGQISHNLYLEVATELGYIGLIIYLFFLRSILLNLKLSREAIKSKQGSDEGFIEGVTMALFIWAVSTFIFSFAQYGLSIYAIYFIAGLAVVLQRLLSAEPAKTSSTHEGVATDGR